MTKEIYQLVEPGDNPVATAFALDGSGSCCGAVLDYHVALEPNSPMDPVVIVTSGMEGHQAAERTAEFQSMGVSLDAHFNANIAGFYAKKGYFTPKTRGTVDPQPWVTLRTPEGIAIREEWTEKVLMHEMDFNGIDLVIFGGFNPLTNMVGEIPCLNPHPGDLTYMKDGQRYLVGWHEEPIERAILEGLDTLRTTVMLAMPYDPKDPLKDMDNGLIVSLSAGVPVDLYGHRLSELKKIAAARPAVRPRAGFKDPLEEIASKNQDNLKKKGDWVALPPAAMDVAQGLIAVERFPDPNAGLLFLEDPYDRKSARPIQHIVYHKTEDNKFEREIIERAA